MSVRKRLGRLEGPRDSDRCPACNDRLVFVEEHEDGTETYPSGEPCSECRGRPGPTSSFVVPCGGETCAICG